MTNNFNPKKSGAAERPQLSPEEYVAKKKAEKDAVYQMIDGEQETHIALPAAGLMSQKPCAEVAGEIAAVQSALDVISDGQLTLLATAIMALPVLPSVVITDMGLVNGANQTFVPVFADAEA